MRIILLNDVSTDLEQFNSSIVLGDIDVPVNDVGRQESIIIGKHLSTETIHLVVSSPADRLIKLLHNLRQREDSPVLARTSSSIPVYISSDLKERSFGVLNGTNIQSESSIFTHTRVCAEGGESVEQCRIRVRNCIDSYCDKYIDKNIVFVSHPHLCQILFNSLTNKDPSYVSGFWKLKGSCAFFDYSDSTWNLEKSYNIVQHEKRVNP
jgi:broad specificity phosphatase PhoE